MMHSLKVVIVGDSQVGKSCIGFRFVQETFNNQTSPTIGAAFLTKVVQTSFGSVRLQLWDTAGQEKFKTLTPMYYRSSGVAIVVFSLTQKETFESVKQWCEDLRNKSAPNTKLVIVGNKNDLVDERVISKEQFDEIAKMLKADYYTECSALTGDGVAELFQNVAEMCKDGKNFIENIENPEAKTEKNSSCC